jgi:hypothetical protein
MAIFGLYSRRKKIREGGMPDVYQYTDVPNPFRVQITHIWEEVFSEGTDPYDAYLYLAKILRKEYGVYKLVSETYDVNDKYQARKEIISFFLNEKNIDKVIDVIEITFRYIDVVTRKYNYSYDNRSNERASEAIEEFNGRAKEHGVGYQYTDGEIIRVDSELVHKEAVVPALTVLRGQKFSSAQDEFLKAHEHYRHGRMSEALVDALKAFESTMKIICDGRGWAYDKSKGASELVRACLDNGLIPPYWQNHFNGLKNVLTSAIPTPRNKQGGHGAGSAPAQVPPSELVSYVLHMTASTILFLSEADKKLP